MRFAVYWTVAILVAIFFPSNHYIIGCMIIAPFVLGAIEELFKKC
jgi:hypothetical protein